MAPLINSLGTVTLLAIAGVLYYGAFSRITHGQYTPDFYAYQLDRAPDDDSTVLLPYIDSLLASACLFPLTRRIGLLFALLFFGYGVWVRFQAGQDLGYDAALFGGAVVAFAGTPSKY